MLSIYTIKNSPRLQYITKVLFETILGVDYRIISDPDKITGEGLFYGILESESVSIPSEGLLFEEDILQRSVILYESDIPALRFSESSYAGYTFDFDIFSSAFYLITQYRYYNNTTYDEHGRYDERADLFFKKRLYKKPVLELYAELIWQRLHQRFPDLTRKQQKPDYCISFDIDAPYLYKYKGFALTAGSLLKSLLRFDIRSFTLQLKVLNGTQDPYDVYNEITQCVPANKLLFFFLIYRNDRQDQRYTFRNKKYKQLIKRISDVGIRTGIHPSYRSFLQEELIRFETSQMGKITGKPVENARMHFLKYRLPETFQYLIQNGIVNDYTLCPINDTGFKTYIARPYHWFDLAANQETGLIIHPTMIMDRSLQKYMQLSPAEAMEEIKNMIDLTYSHGGIFTILFHNNSLSETYEWKGWKTVFETTIEYLKAKNPAV